MKLPDMIAIEGWEHLRGHHQAMLNLATTLYRGEDPVVPVLIAYGCTVLIAANIPSPVVQQAALMLATRWADLEQYRPLHLVVADRKVLMVPDPEGPVKPERGAPMRCLGIDTLQPAAPPINPIAYFVVDLTNAATRIRSNAQDDVPAGAQVPS